MSLSSLSLTFFNRAAPTPAAPAGMHLAPAPAPLRLADDRGEQHGGARPKALYNAILSAVHDLGMPAAPAAPVDTAGSADAAPSAAATPSVKGAVFEFTRALFQALGGGSATAGGEQSHSNHGRGHAYAYGRTAHAWSRDGFAGLADRLEGLAASLSSQATPVTPAASAAPSMADPTAPTAQPAPTASPAPTSSTLPSAPGAPAAPATGPVAEGPANGAATPATASTGTVPGPAPTDASGSNPLVSAFNGLLQALHVPVAEDPSGGDVAAKLASFLHSLAQALQPTQAQPVAPAPGVLLNETA